MSNPEVPGLRRKYPSLPRVTGDAQSHTLVLGSIKEAIEIHERRTQNYRDSFVSLGEMIDLGYLKVQGNDIVPGDNIGSGLEPGPEGYILATIDGELAWVPFDGLPVPMIYTFDPEDIPQGNPQFSLTILGWGFTEYTTATFDSVEVAVGFVDDTEITLTIPTSLLGSTGFVDVVVTNPAPVGGSDTAQYEITGNPVPVLTLLTPDFSAEDGPTLTVTITGTGFVANSQARWEGSNRTTTYNSATEIEVEILSTDLTTSGTFQIDVVNPTPGGGTSNTLDFEVTNEWTPANITTQVWFDAADSGSVTIATGVSQWNDKSGNARHVVQATGANQPAYNSVQLNSLATLSFDGTNDCLRLTGGVSGLMQNVNGASLYIVRRHTIATPVTNSDFVFTIADTTPNTARVALYGAVDSRVRTGGKRTDAESFVQIEIGGSGWYIINDDTWEINAIVLDYANADGFAYLNGAYSAANTAFATAGSTSNTSANSLNVGSWIDGTSFHQGDIAEIIVTHSADPSERALVEGYLAHKWGLA